MAPKPSAPTVAKHSSLPAFWVLIGRGAAKTSLEREGNSQEIELQQMLISVDIEFYGPLSHVIRRSCGKPAEKGLGNLTPKIRVCETQAFYSEEF